MIERIEGIAIYPASAFVTTKERKEQAIRSIQDDLTERVATLKELGKTSGSKEVVGTRGIRYRNDTSWVIALELRIIPGILTGRLQGQGLSACWIIFRMTS